VALEKPDAVAVSNDGASVYVGAYGEDNIEWFKRLADGTLKEKGCIGDEAHNYESCAQTAKGLLGVDALAISRDGKSLYSANFGGSAVSHMQRDTSTGKLTGVGCFADVNQNPDGCGGTVKGLTGATGVAITHDGTSVYATGYDSNALVHFERDTTTGGLTGKGCVGETGVNPDGCTKTSTGVLNPQDVLASNDGQTVYVASYGDRAVTWFTRATNGGALTFGDCIEKTAAGTGCSQNDAGVGYPVGLAITKDDTNLYSAGDGSGYVTRFKRTP
jgi:DNA-binding beta-propeller fold protein YncE